MIASPRALLRLSLALSLAALSGCTLDAAMLGQLNLPRTKAGADSGKAADPVAPAPAPVAAPGTDRTEKRPAAPTDVAPVATVGPEPAFVPTGPDASAPEVQETVKALQEFDTLAAYADLFAEDAAAATRTVLEERPAPPPATAAAPPPPARTRAEERLKAEHDKLRAAEPPNVKDLHEKFRGATPAVADNDLGGKTVTVEVTLEARAADNPALVLKRKIRSTRAFDQAHHLVNTRFALEAGLSDDSWHNSVWQSRDFGEDGAIRTTFEATQTVGKDGVRRTVKWEKQVSPDGAVKGRGTIETTGPRGAKKAELTLGAPPIAEPRPSAEPSRAVEPTPPVESTRPTPTPTPTPGTATTAPNYEQLADAGQFRVEAVRPLTIKDDSQVAPNKGNVTIQFASSAATHFGTGVSRTYVRVFTAQRTAEPGSGGVKVLGAIAAPPIFVSNVAGQVTLNTTVLKTGTYYLRATTFGGGELWEVAEGVLVVH